MTKVWTFDVEPALRRYNPRGGQPYRISHDRCLPTSHREISRHASQQYSVASNDHHGELDAEQKGTDEKQRRRIPVACGRCRKRKIRCSGPTPGDMGCQNCKLAGNDNCQFNRVSSAEIPFKENPMDYPYDPYAARLQHRLVPQSIFSSYVPGVTMMPLAHSLPYRSMSVSDYQYSKPNWSIPTYGPDYSDNSEYVLSGVPCNSLNQENVATPTFNSQSGTRGWTLTSQVAKPAASMYLDLDSSLSFGQPNVAYSNSSYTFRPNISAESNNFSFSGMANSLPNPPPSTSSTDRMLPIPSSRQTQTQTQVHTQIAVSRSAEDLKQSPNTLTKTLSSSNLISSSQSTYVQPLSSSPESPQSFNANGLISSQNHDIYSPGLIPSDTWTPATSLAHEPTLRSQDSHNDMYTYSNSSTERKPSQSEQSTLVNGHMYVPYPQSGDISRTTSIDVVNVATHRTSVGSLRAV